MYIYRREFTNWLNHIKRETKGSLRSDIAKLATTALPKCEKFGGSVGRMMDLMDLSQHRVTCAAAAAAAAAAASEVEAAAAATHASLNDLPHEMLRLVLHELHRERPFAPAVRVCTAWCAFYADDGFWLELCARWPSSLQLPRPPGLARARGLYLAFARGCDERNDREAELTPLHEMWGVEGEDTPADSGPPPPSGLMLVMEAESLVAEHEEQPPHRLIFEMKRTIVIVQPLDESMLTHDHGHGEGEHVFDLPINTSPLWEPTQLHSMMRDGSLDSWRKSLIQQEQAVTLMALFHAPSQKICFLIRPDKPSPLEGCILDDGHFEPYGYAFSHFDEMDTERGLAWFFDPWGRAEARMAQYIAGLGLDEDDGGVGAGRPPLKVMFNLGEAWSTLISRCRSHYRASSGQGYSRKPRGKRCDVEVSALTVRAGCSLP